MKKLDRRTTSHEGSLVRENSPVSKFLVLAAALILGAASATPAGNRDNNTTELRFSYWGNVADNAIFRELAESFENRHPGVRIKLEWVVGDYGMKLPLLLVSETAADILLMDDEIFPAYSTRGYLEDLTPYIERDKEEFRAEEFLPTALESFNWKGFQAGLPWDGNVVIVLYNKDLFDAEGIPYPTKDWTWDEFRAIAKRLTKDYDNDGYPDQFGTNIEFEFKAILPILWSFGGALLNEDCTRSALESPESLEGAQFVFDMLYKDGSVARTMDMGVLINVQLLTGRIAMLPALTYELPMLNRIKDGPRWGMAHLPIGPRGHRYTRVTWDGISINAHTTREKKEIAWQFIKFLVGPEGQALIGKTQRGLPVRRPQVLSHYIKEETLAEEEIALEATDYGRLCPITTRHMELREAANIEYSRLIVAEASGATPAQVFARLGPKFNAILAREADEWNAKFGAVADEEAPSASWSGVKALGFALLLAVFSFGTLLLLPPVRRRFSQEIAELRHLARSKAARTEALEGLLFALPWLLGLCLFTAFPILFSVVLSFCEWDPYDPIADMRFTGLENFKRACSTDPVTGDPLVAKALYNTFYYAFFAVPLCICTSLGLALLLNQKFRGISIFRTTFYLPSVVSGVATVVLWVYIFNPVFGPVNTFLRAANRFFNATGILAFIDLPVPYWLGDPAWTKPAMIIMALWVTGGAGTLVFLAGLQGVPDQLYEAAEIDGAGRFRKFWNITLPMLTPTIYFNLIMGVIGALKVFMQAYVLTDGLGGVDQSLLFFVVHLYNKAFVSFEMGYASALAWILFSIILLFTLLIVRSSSTWVYYEGERPAR